MAACFRLLLATALLAALAVECQAGVNITTLPISFIVTTSINNQSVSASNNQMTYLVDNLTVYWELNASYIGQDSAYQKVLIRLCYGYPSIQARPWRAPNQDLSYSKQCSTTIAGQPYVPSQNVTPPANSTGSAENGTSPGNSTATYSATVPMNMTVWQAGRNVPGAFYFVRVFALNSSSSDATPANNAVAMGQSTNANATTNLVQVNAYMGTTITLDVVIIVVSVASYVLLFSIFFVERWIKKNK